VFFLLAGLHPIYLPLLAVIIFKNIQKRFKSPKVAVNFATTVLFLRNLCVAFHVYVTLNEKTSYCAAPAELFFIERGCLSKTEI
jgi:hypothetical protein